jgi:hypothetical protein
MKIDIHRLQKNQVTVLIFAVIILSPLVGGSLRLTHAKVIDKKIKINLWLNEQKKI